jgi:hypothetical protein
LHPEMQNRNNSPGINEMYFAILEFFMPVIVNYSTN